MDDIFYLSKESKLKFGYYQGRAVGALPPSFTQDPTLFYI